MNMFICQKLTKTSKLTNTLCKQNYSR